MFASIWNAYLYQPLFNLLIWLYNNWTNTNLGWAVVELTIILRIALLPFSLVGERNRIRNTELAREVEELNKRYHNDAVIRKEEIRKVLKKRKVQPWTKIVVLGIQLLVLILLYQVFLRGITGDKIAKFLYPFVQFPGAINTNFFGFELGRRHDALWAGAAAVWLAIEIYLDFRKKKKMGVPAGKSDVAFFLLFPLSVFFILFYLPMVKSLFILTSLAFSVIISWFSTLIFRSGEMKN